MTSLVDPGGGGALPACAPLNWIQFFHFHQKVPTSDIGTPQTAQCPPTGNPGSASGHVAKFHTHNLYILLHLLLA